jgi:hypothetical protein
MSNKINFLISTATKTGILFSLELSNFCKKDSLNEYHENKIIIQFYSSYSFFLLYREKEYKGILLSSIFLNLVKNNTDFKKNLNGIIEGILIVFKNLKQFQEITALLKTNINIKKKSKKFLECEKLLKYLIDRKKKLNF